MKMKRLKILGEQNEHTNVSSIPKNQTFKSRSSLSMGKKHLKVLEDENKHTNCALDPKDQTFKSKAKTFKSEINP